MKKKLLTVLALMLVCLCGCVRSEDAGETTVPTETDPSTVFTTPEDPGSSLIEYDPDREVYFTFHNCDYTIYLDDSWVPYLQFYIISKEPVDLGTLKLSIPISARYTIAYKEEVDLNIGIADSTDPAVRSWRQEAFPYYLYLCYKGIDFKEIGELRENDPEAYSEKVAQLSSYANEFNGLTPEDLPQFHVYAINVQFDSETATDESFSELDIRIGDQVYHEEIGTVRLKKTIPFYIQYDWELVAENVDDGICGYGIEPTPYFDGLHKITAFYNFTVDYTKKVTSLSFLNKRIQFVDAIVHVTSADGTYMEYNWSGEDPLYFYPGDDVFMDVIVRIPDSDQLDQTLKVWGVLEYECEYGTYHKLSEAHVRRSINFYELYAMVFDGLDLEDYYRYYYYPENYDEQWRNDYQE